VVVDHKLVSFVLLYGLVLVLILVLTGNLESRARGSHTYLQRNSF
jgi:hypothetical protein